MMALLLKLKIIESDALLELLDEVEGKVIIWANYVMILEHIVKAVSKEVWRRLYSTILWCYSGRRKTKQYEKFQDPNSKAKILCW